MIKKKNFTPASDLDLVDPVDDEFVVVFDHLVCQGLGSLLVN